MKREIIPIEYESRFLPGIDLYNFTFDDISLRDGYSDFIIDDVDTKSKVTRRITQKTPIIGPPMDTVIESKAAIALALEGGLGIIHYNFEDLGMIVRELERVKRFEAGFVEYPVTLSPENIIDDAARINRELGISTIPITKDGKPNGKLVGMLTKNDYSMLKHKGKKVKSRMTGKDKLITVKLSEMTDDHENRLAYANNILLESHMGALHIVDDHGNLTYLVTRSDIEKNEQYPFSNKDGNKRLRVGIAIGPKDEYKDIAKEAIKKGASVIVIDTAKGNAKYAIEFLEYLKGLSDDVDMVGGTVSTAEGTINLLEAGSDAIRTNGASGTTCITEIMTGVGTPQGTAILDCKQAALRYAEEHGTEPIPIWADGAMEKIGHIIKGIGLGASATMSGYLLTGCDEAPGWKIDPETGKRIKLYRGMGSVGAMEKRSSVRYASSKVPEGIEGEVEPTGSIHEWVPYMMTAFKKGMEKAGARTIPDLWKATIGPRVKEEAGVHGIHSYRQVKGMGKS